MPKEGFFYISRILTDFVAKIDKSYYPQVFLTECKYIVKQKKMIKSINGELEISSDKSDDNISN